ncbi:hypothetical protein [Actinomycetospora termitidis]|uniref:Uncharacterized protein n=1 Tax=Actinomycetospora termitidis TaxID=3053470 RepID=A0ABT7MFI6_9PSEU|nr:hypothetical protein [Actinomycetospora sp. Odt1-22]MDL5159429.1 hypothetical protein [Actinomycetospora sp. Odt1-22]
MPTVPLHGGPHDEGSVDVELDPSGRLPTVVACLDADARSVEYVLDEDGVAYSYRGFVTPEGEH